MFARLAEPGSPNPLAGRGVSLWLLPITARRRYASQPRRRIRHPSVIGLGPLAQTDKGLACGRLGEVGLRGSPQDGA